MTSVRTVRLVLIGTGNLGRRFARLLEEKHEELLRRYRLDVRLVGVADSRGAAIDPKGLSGSEVFEIKAQGGSVGELPGAGRPGMSGVALIDAVEADVLCEASPVHLQSGAEPGLTHVRHALEKGLHVTTPNKGPIVTSYRMLTALAREHGVALRFDGTVAGGLPALTVGARDLRGAVIHRMEAMPNLTTGFVLDRLAAGETWGEATAAAREAGVLEGDGVWDLDGWDAAAKLVILAQAVLDCDVTLDDVPREGIREIDRTWLKAVTEEGRSIRLLATAVRQPDGTYTLGVAPTAMPAEHPLAGLGSHGMGLMMETDIYGTISTLIHEPTPLPSAATMLRDLLDICESEAYSIGPK